MRFGRVLMVLRFLTLFSRASPWQRCFHALNTFFSCNFRCWFAFALEVSENCIIVFHRGDTFLCDLRPALDVGDPATGVSAKSSMSKYHCS
jgi:hypothetical protein